MHGETVFILMFMVATAVAIMVRRLRIPYTVALVVAGLILGVTHAFEPPHLTRDLLFSVFLPGLLFEAAFHLEFRAFWQERTAVFALAVPGVIAATVLVTLIITPVADALDFVTRFHWHYALVFGALISATDPIAVVGLFRSLGAPKRLAVLMESESLLNDGTAIVFFTLALALATGSQVQARGLAMDFLVIVGAGLLVGTGVGLAASQVIKQVDEPMIEITITTIAAYGSFVLAEQLHYSGVIAVVTAGLFCGNYGARVGMSPSTRIAVETFWEYIAFALNSMVFLLIGFEIHLKSLLHSWQAVLVAYLAVTAGRAVVITGVSALLHATRNPISRSWSAIVTWGGLRGGLSMVLVLSLAPDFPHRDLLVNMTFGVVFLSILIQGVTMAPLLRKLGVVTMSTGRTEYEVKRGLLQAANAALEEIEDMARTRATPTDVLGELREAYRKAVDDAESELREMHVKEDVLHRDEMRWARRHLLLVEKNKAISAYHQGTLSHEAYEKLLADVDARLVEVESGVTAEPEPEEETVRRAEEEDREESEAEPGRGEER